MNDQDLEQSDRHWPNRPCSTLLVQALAQSYLGLGYFYLGQWNVDRPSHFGNC